MKNKKARKNEQTRAKKRKKEFFKNGSFFPRKISYFLRFLLDIFAVLPYIHTHRIMKT
ncbi:MAG: hypothetical protein IKZ47_01860 [Clostridia bacterium]|nr:hypothetical protein [Clostridia bacterium]